MSDDWSWRNSDGTESALVLWDVSSSAGYDWWTTAIVMNSKGEYAVYSDSGCSCNGAFERGWDKYDLAWNADLNEVKRQAREYVSKTEKISVGRKADNLSKLARLSK